MVINQLPEDQKLDPVLLQKAITKKVMERIGDLLEAIQLMPASLGRSQAKEKIFAATKLLERLGDKNWLDRKSIKRK